jgi:hypothetical protein
MCLITSVALRRKGIASDGLLRLAVCGRRDVLQTGRAKVIGNPVERLHS